jgi:hypothetical protein
MILKAIAAAGSLSSGFLVSTSSVSGFIQFTAPLSNGEGRKSTT